MYKEWYSKEKQKVFHLFTRIGDWFATDEIGKVRDNIYIFPTLTFYINHSSWHVGFRWFVFKFDMFYENYIKREEFHYFSITGSRNICRYCVNFESIPNTAFGKCRNEWIGKVYHYDHCAMFQQKSRNFAFFNNLILTTMSKKTLALITAIVGGLQTIGVGFVTFYGPEHSTAINSAIVIAGAAIIEICTLFTSPEPEPEKKE